MGVQARGAIEAGQSGGLGPPARASGYVPMIVRWRGDARRPAIVGPRGSQQRLQAVVAIVLYGRIANQRHGQCTSAKCDA